MERKFVPKLDFVCSEEWGQMAGDEKRRFCERCQLHVHHLDEITEGQRRALLATPGARVCVTYRVTPETVAVRPSLWVLRQSVLRPFRATAALLTLLLCHPAGSKAATASRPPAHHSHHATNCSVSDGKTTGGVMMIPTPLWRRIVFFWQNW